MGLLPAIISGLLSAGTIITNKLVGLLQQRTLCADFWDCINPLGTLPQGFWGQCRWSWVVWVDRSQAKGGAEVPLQPAVLPGTWPGSCRRCSTAWAKQRAFCSSGDCLPGRNCWCCAWCWPNAEGVTHRWMAAGGRSLWSLDFVVDPPLRLGMLLSLLGCCWFLLSLLCFLIPCLHPAGAVFSS